MKADKDSPQGHTTLIVYLSQMNEILAFLGGGPYLADGVTLIIGLTYLRG